jgi:hypothetical protein
MNNFNEKLPAWAVGGKRLTGRASYQGTALFPYPGSGAYNKGGNPARKRQRFEEYYRNLLSAPQS